MQQTPEQLKLSAAAMLAYAGGKSIQFYMDGKWRPTRDIRRIDEIPHRPRPDPGPWSSPDDVPAFCWLRSTKWVGIVYLVNSLTEEGAWTSNGCGNQLWSWNRLRDADAQYSTDRRTWFPCEVQE